MVGDNLRSFNRYEKSMLSNLTVLKCMFLAVVLLNLFLPIVYPNRLGITVLLQWIVIGFHGWSLLYGLGYLMGQKIHVVKVLITRIVEVLFYLYFDDVNWIPFSLLFILDLAFFYWLYMCKAKYGFDKSKIKEVEV